MIKNVLNKFGFVRIALVAGAGLPLIVASNAFAQAPPPPAPRQAVAPTEAVAERVIVTGSNIPTAAEQASIPVTTSRPSGSRNRALIRRRKDCVSFPPLSETP